MFHRSILGSAIMALALVSLEAGCTRAVSKTSAGAPLNVTIHFPAREKPDVVPGMLMIDVETAGGSDFRQETVAVTGQPTRSVTTIHGETFEVVGDELHFGTKRYGPLAAGQVLRVTKDGVLLDGKRIEPR